jgi:hypothetical protein
MDPKTLSTIWGTYMKLVTKYQISVHSTTTLCIIPQLPEGGGGILFYVCPSVRPSVLPSFRPSVRPAVRPFTRHYTFFFHVDALVCQNNGHFQVWELNIGYY